MTAFTRKRPRLLTGIGLLALLLVNAAPLYFVARQAFAPPGDATGWPLRLRPSRVSMANLERLWTSERLGVYLARSAGVATGSTLASLLLGFPAGWGLVRFGRLTQPGTNAAILARVLPPMAIAIPLAGILIRFGLYNRPTGAGLVFAHLTITLPFAILLAYAAFRDVPAELEEAAWVDGCGPFTAFVRIALPAVRSAMAAAAILCFLLSWDEFAFALLIQPINRTVPTLIYYYANFGQLGSASALAVLMLVPACLVIVVLLTGIGRGALTGGVKG